MRLSVSIISLYFLFLAVHPCHCNLYYIDFCADKTEHAVLSSVDNRLPDGDACTPFCTCSNVHNSNFIISNDFDLHFGACTSVTEIAL